MIKLSKFRIVERPTVVRPSQAVYDVQERSFLLFWDYRGTFSTFGQALARIDELENEPEPIKRKVAYERF